MHAAGFSTVNQLADALDGEVTRSHLYNLMSVKTVIDLSELEVICRTIGVSYVDLVSEAQDQVGKSRAAH